MLKRALLIMIGTVLSTTVFALAEEKATEQQKQIPENKGMITIDMPESKKNVTISPEMITPPDKTETIIKILPTDQKIITRTIGTDPEQVFPAKFKLNFEGKYYIPAEGTTEWYTEAVKNNKEGIKWENFSDDLFINRPGDTWNDLSKMFYFQFATTVSSLAFLSFAQTDGLKTEGRIKGFLLTAAIVTGLEIINSTHPKQHFCAKNFAAGLTGSLCGSFVLTAGFGF
ncbi:MAG: hypothetical protein V1752_07995 [Candidatus Firestonebacteria bacterium]